MWKISNLVWFSPPKNLEECDDSKEKRERNHFGKKIPVRRETSGCFFFSPWDTFPTVCVVLLLFVHASQSIEHRASFLRHTIHSFLSLLFLFFSCRRSPMSYWNSGLFVDDYRPQTYQERKHRTHNGRSVSLTTLVHLVVSKHHGGDAMCSRKRVVLWMWFWGLNITLCTNQKKG